MESTVEELLDGEAKYPDDVDDDEVWDVLLEFTWESTKFLVTVVLLILVDSEIELRKWR